MSKESDLKRELILNTSSVWRGEIIPAVAHIRTAGMSIAGNTPNGKPLVMAKRRRKNKTASADFF